MPATPQAVATAASHHAAPAPDDLVDKARFARASGLSVHTIDSWVRSGRIPKPIKFGTHRNAPIRWRWRVIQEWIASYEAAQEESY